MFEVVVSVGHLYRGKFACSRQQFDEDGAAEALDYESGPVQHLDQSRTMSIASVRTRPRLQDF